MPADPVTMLDHPGVGLELIFSSADLQKVSGEQIHLDQDTSHPDIYQELHLDQTKRPVEPLFDGKWK